MDADEVFWFCRSFGQACDGQGGCVGPKNAALYKFRLRFFSYIGFDVAAFKHGLDDEVAAFQIVIVCCRCDLGQQCGFLCIGRLATGNGFVEETL